MNGMIKLRESEQGSVLVVVMAILFITAGLVITILDVASDHRDISVRQVSMDQAMYVAEAGLERGARLMETNLATIVSSSTGATNGSGTVGSGTYSFYIVRTNTSTYCIISTGTVSGVKRVVSLMDVYQPTYAEFALWSHVNGAIYFVNGDVFSGHVHADDELYFKNTNGGPVFHAPVTSDVGTYSGNISGIEFDDGLTLNSYQGTMADVDFNSGASTSLKSEAQANGLVLSGNTTITFAGTAVKITNTKTNWTNHSYTFPQTGGIIYVANNGSTTGSKAGMVFVNGGTLSGPLTVASENDMDVLNSVTYAHDPVANPSTTDALGLISQDDIWVDTSAPNDLEIDAAMIAAGTSSDGSNGSFGVTSYSSGSPRGNLTVYGGIVQEQRGAVGTTSNGTISTGYAKNYSYDPRFLTKPPPYYPTISSMVSFAQWTEGH